MDDLKKALANDIRRMATGITFGLSADDVVERFCELARREAREEMVRCHVLTRVEPD